MSSTPPPPPGPTGGSGLSPPAQTPTPSPPGGPQPLPPPSAETTSSEAQAPWPAPQPARGGNSGGGGKRGLLIAGLGILAVVLLVLAIVVIGGDDDSGTSANEPVPGASVADLRRESPGHFDAGEPIPVTLQEGDVSFLLTAVADDQNEFVAIESVTDPDGEVIYAIDESGELSGGLTDNFLEAEGEVSVLAPVHPGLDVRPGTYEVTTSVPAEATVLIKSGEAAADVPQFIDLNLWRVSPDIDTATLEQEVRTRVDEVLGNQNLTVGSVNLVEADPADVDRFAEIDEGQASEVCSAMTAAVGESRSLDLAILESITKPDGGTLLGFSAGLPGSSPAPGVTKTCTLAATRGVELPTFAATLVHEGSHFMGLTHTSEANGLLFDDFDDTGECDISADGRDNDELGIPGTSDGEVDEAECGEAGGGNNYMFPSSGGLFPQDEMSPDQAWALRRHPLVYAAP